MLNLFGEQVEYKEKTFEDEYDEYIHSLKWRQKAAAALERAGHKCQRCGYTKFSKRLEVHHKTYDHFKHERPEDLEVVCKECHQFADEERRNRTFSKQAAALYDARLNGWATVVFGDDWQDREDVEDVEEQFDDWLSRNSYHGG